MIIPSKRLTILPSGIIFLITCAFLFLLVPTISDAQVTANQVDNFNDGTLQNWEQGNQGPEGLSNQTNRLQITADGTGAFSRLVAANSSKWSGNYISEGITFIKMRVNNISSSSTLNLRLAFGNGATPNTTNSTWFSSTNAVVATTGSGEMEVVFSIKEADMTKVQGTATYADVFSSVVSLRLVNGSSPTNKGDVVVATLRVDDITACIPFYSTPYHESIEGDLSNYRTVPTAIVLSSGDNVISACMQFVDVDYFTFEVPANSVLSAIELQAFTSAGNAFLGIQTGATFTEPRFTPTVGNLLGGIIYGTGNIGMNILPEIGQLDGAIGFTGALPAGQYTIWLNENSGASCPTLNLVLSDIVDSCPETLVFDNQMIASNMYNAFNSITTMNSVSIETGATVVFEAGQCITLQPGFIATATNNGSFTARIFNCATAILETSEEAIARSNNFLLSTKFPKELEATIYPNPTYKDATLLYEMPAKESIIITMFTSNGVFVRQLLKRQLKEGGVHTLPFNTSTLSTGIYFIDIQTKERRIYRKISIIRQP